MYMFVTCGKTRRERTNLNSYYTLKTNFLYKHTLKSPDLALNKFTFILKTSTNIVFSYIV